MHEVRSNILKNKMRKLRYLWYTDCHLNFTLPWTPRLFAENILDENPDGVFLTGDIACGISLSTILTILAKKLCPIPLYFIKGNHDWHGSSFAAITQQVTDLQKRFPNLIWLTQQEVIKLTPDVALIGTDGWYDLRVGDPKLAVYNFDWILIEEFRKLKSFEEKRQLSQKLADASAADIKRKLLKALEDFQTVYILSHMVPYKEAAPNYGPELTKYWVPYDTNSILGKTIEEVMADRANQNVIILVGHVHNHKLVRVSHNIECIVGEGKYLGDPKPHQEIFI